MRPREREAQLVVIRALMEGGTTDLAALLVLEADLINQGVAACYGDDLYEHGSDGAYMGAVLREHAREYGRENPDCQWINTPWDTWEPNPFYQGKPQPHPESDEE